ncbi:surface lipoprotein assembly modifier [Sulfurimonas sp. HSL3-2]|uniref:surface lipoprotein assembly modifier n=1 Tax=Hydrocurvibacter mobilis TaxID=3131936 RepID=UPI0031FA374A
MKIFVFLLSINVLLLASYEKADQFYKAKEYEKAVAEAKASTDEYQTPRLHLLWAKSAEALGSLNEAMSAYERVLILDENNSEAKTALIRLYKQSGKDELAYEMSDSLKPAGQRSSPDPLKAKASAAIGYDSNINVTPGSGVLDNYYGTTNNEGVLSTMFSRFTGDVSYRDNFQENNGAYYKGAARVYYQNNFKESRYNLFSGSLEVGGGYKEDGYDLYIPLVYDDVYYLDKKLFHQYALSPRLTMFLTDELICNLNASYTKRYYSGSSNQKIDIDILGSAVDLYYIFDKNYLFLKTAYETFHTGDTGGTLFINKRIFTASLGVNYKVVPWLIARIDYKFIYASFDDDVATIYTTDNTRRLDNLHQVELKLSHNLKDNLELYLSDRYAKNTSNYVPAEYSKNIIMLGIGLNY